MINIANKPNILFTQFEYSSDYPKSKKTSAEQAANFLLTPVRNIFGYTKVTTDGNKLIESTKVTAKKIHTVASVIFAILLFPVAAVATITGFVILLSSKSHNAIYNKIFNPPNPRERIDDPNQDKGEGKKVEHLEITFWEDHFKNKDLHRLLELVIRDNLEAIKDNYKKELNKIGSFVVDHYINYKKTHQKKLALSDSEREILVKSFLKQLVNSSLHPIISEDSKKSDGQAIYREIQLPTGTLKVYDTLGDGSCGFHALFGAPVNGIFTTDAIARRTEFCHSIRERWENNNLPDQIENILKDYFSHYPNVPLFLHKENILLAFSGLRDNYESLNNEEKDKRFKEFLSNKEVFNAYIAHMAEVGTYLTQDELEVVAICSNRTIKLYQPGWGNDAEIGVSELNPGHGNEVVEIYYNGHNHYERAQFVKKKKEPAGKVTDSSAVPADILNYC